MPQKQSPRVPVLPPSIPEWDVQPTEAPAIDLTPLIRLASLAQRMAARYVAGKSGLALENDARETVALWNALPDEIKAML